mgnify:FL=1
MKREKNYNDYPLKKKLLISHGIIVLLSMIITIVLLSGMVFIKSKVDGLYERPLKNIDAVGDIRYGVVDVLRAMDRIIAEDQRDSKEAYELMEADVEEDVELILAGIETLKSGLMTGEGTDLLNQIIAAVDNGEAIRPRVMEALKEDSGSAEAYDLCFNEYLPEVEGIAELTDELETQIRNTATEYYQSARIQSFIYIVLGICLVAVGVVLAVVITAKVTRAIVVPLKQLTDVSIRLHEGDMSARFDISYEGADEIGVMSASLRSAMEDLALYIKEISDILKDLAKGDLTKDSAEITDFLGDFADIKDSFIFILKRFNSTLSEIQDSSDLVANSSHEIASASQALSEGASDQASAIEELTATITTVSDLAEESAKSTEEAYTNIRISAEQAENEKQKMQELTLEMRRITEISREIENIITAIEDIASQTNLLSLNASIEAARAGESGRGFAVVADQIGKLATDSAQSAVNTRELIQKTLTEIEKGNAITASTSEAFDKIIADMKSFADIAQHSSEAARSQSTALAQIEQGIDQIAEVVQNTAASSEESSAISGNLSEEASDLDNLIKRFKLF